MTPPDAECVLIRASTAQIDQRHPVPDSRIAHGRSARCPIRAVSPGSRPDALNIIVEGLRADDARTESILRRHIELTPEQWAIHQYSDLHLTARDAKPAGMITDIGDFSPPKGAILRNM